MTNLFENFEKELPASSKSISQSRLTLDDVIGSVGSVIGDPLITLPVKSLIKNVHKIQEENENIDFLLEETQERYETIQELKKRNEELRSLLEADRKEE